MKKLVKVRATLRADGWFGVAVQYDHDLAAALRRVRPHEYTRAVWIADVRPQRATWWFPPRHLQRLRWLLAAYDIELVVPGDAFAFKYRYRDGAGRFVNPWKEGKS